MCHVEATIRALFLRRLSRRADFRHFVYDRLSYQRHTRGDEHWFIVSGSAVVTLDGVSHRFSAGDSIDISTGAAHRVANCECELRDLVVIEVQHGEYFGEDDIERLADDYGRAS